MKLKELYCSQNPRAPFGGLKIPVDTCDTGSLEAMVQTGANNSLWN